MENDKNFYVYRWYYKDTNETFHIGKGKNNRYKQKFQSRNEYFKNIIKKEQDNVTSEILFNNLTEQQAWDLEKQLIAEYKAKGECKTNFHEGGCGGNTGHYDSSERSKKLSEAAKKRIGPLNPMYGKHHSEETRQKISETKKSRKIIPYNKGKKGLYKHSEKTKSILKEKSTKYSKKDIDELRRLYNELGTYSAVAKVKNMNSNIVSRLIRFGTTACYK